MIASVKQAAARKYLTLSLARVRRSLTAQQAERSFRKVVIVAELQRNTGIARGAWLQYQFFKRLGLDVELLDVTGCARNPFYRVDHEPGSVYIFHSGGPQIATLLKSVLPNAANAYRIAYWAWELAVPPLGWPPADGIVSEIWTCSRFSRESLQLAYNVPVISVPHILPPVPSCDRNPRGETFEVLTFADTRSSLRRKNPAGAINAFLKAFGDSRKARLTLKLTGSPAECAAFLGTVPQPANFRVITDYLSEEAISQLFRSSDALLSLHRAEGFGLPMFEAMSHGLPVIATKWSGNLEYMDESNSMLVPCSFVNVGDDPVYGNYAEGSWAEPDVERAAGCLKMLASDHGIYHRISDNAASSVSRFGERQIRDNALGLTKSRAIPNSFNSAASAR